MNNCREGTCLCPENRKNGTCLERPGSHHSFFSGSSTYDDSTNYKPKSVCRPTVWDSTEQHFLDSILIIEQCLLRKTLYRVPPLWLTWSMLSERSCLWTVDLWQVSVRRLSMRWTAVSSSPFALWYFFSTVLAFFGAPKHRSEGLPPGTHWLMGILKFQCLQILALHSLQPLRFLTQH